MNNDHDASALERLTMKPGETVRFACGDCQIVFDLCVAPPSEWAEEFEEGTEPKEIGEPIQCPFCGDAELNPTHDRPTVG